MQKSYKKNLYVECVVVKKFHETPKPNLVCMSLYENSKTEPHDEVHKLQ